jgi:hypothetical protein
MTTTINRRNYIDLLDRVEIVPKVIETESEYDRFLQQIDLDVAALSAIVFRVF